MPQKVDSLPEAAVFLVWSRRGFMSGCSKHTGDALLGEVAH